MASTKRKKPQAKQKQAHQKNGKQRPPNQYKKNFDPRLVHKNKDRCSKYRDSAHLEGFQCPVKNISATSQAFASKKHNTSNPITNTGNPPAHQLKAGTIYVHDSNEEVNSSDNSFCLQLKIQHMQAHPKKTQKPVCLVTNLTYRLKQHENRKLYLRARLDTCADVNIMPVSVYKLVFRDPNLEKLAPNKMQIGTYTNDRVKIVGTCKLYLVHLDTKN